MATGTTARVWTMAKLLGYRVPATVLDKLASNSRSWLEKPIRPMSAGVSMVNLTLPMSLLKPHMPSKGHHPGRQADSGLFPHAAVPWWWNRSGLYGSGLAVESSGRLGRIDVQDGSRFLQAVQQRFEQVLHGGQCIGIEQGSHLLPQQAFAAPLGPGRLEQRATELLDLID